MKIIDMITVLTLCAIAGCLVAEAIHTVEYWLATGVFESFLEVVR